MISTMPKSGQAPTSPNAMPGGLGAILQQPGAAPKGASSRSMQQVVDTARKMSDMQLADVLSGKSLDVPQYVAMTEAMGRKSLRTAMQGAQAQQQLNKPSVKDRLLAEEAQATQMAQAPQGGIDQLPAPNMGSVDMAGGGIVAFADNKDQPVREGMEGNSSVFPEPSGFDKKLWNALKEKFSELNQPWGKTVDASPAEVRGAMTGKNLVPGARSSAPVPAMSPDQLNAISQGQGVFPEGSVALPGAGLATAPAVPAGGPTQAQRDAFYEKGAPKKSGIAAALDGETEPKKTADDYLAKLAGIGEKTRSGIAGLKNEAQSQILLDAMSALMGSRNLAEAGGKFGTLAAGRVGAMGKEGRALEKEANEYDLNLARYQEAVKSGDKDRAMQLKKMLLENQYHMAMVNKPDSGIAMLNALKDPKMMELYQQMNASKKPMDVVSRKDAMEDFNKYPALKRQYGDFENYYKSVNGQLLSATIPGQGANVIGTLK